MRCTRPPRAPETGGCARRPQRRPALPARGQHARIALASCPYAPENPSHSVPRRSERLGQPRPLGRPDRREEGRGRGVTDRLLTTREVAERYGVTPETILRW